MGNEDFNKAFEQALRFLGPRFLSRQELTVKLRRKKYANTVIQQVIDRLEKMDYMDDERLAKGVASYLMKENKYGRLYIQKKLMNRGLPIPSILYEYNEREAANYIIDRYFPSGEGPYERNKIIRFLKNRGFHQSTILEICSVLCLDIEEYC